MRNGGLPNKTVTRRLRNEQLGKLKTSSPRVRMGMVSLDSVQCEAQAPTDEGEPSNQDLRGLRVYGRALLDGSHRDVDPRAESLEPLDLSGPDQAVQGLQEFLEGEGGPMHV